MHKKWYIQSELFGLTKKLATVIVGHFSLEKRRLKTPNFGKYKGKGNEKTKAL